MQAVGQPFLHELVACVRAPTCVLSGATASSAPTGRTACSTPTSATSPSSSSPSTVSSRRRSATGCSTAARAAFVGAVRGTSATRSPTRRCASSGRVGRPPTASSTSIAVVNDSRADIAVGGHRPRGERPRRRSARSSRGRRRRSWRRRRVRRTSSAGGRTTVVHASADDGDVTTHDRRRAPRRALDGDDRAHAAGPRCEVVVDGGGRQRRARRRAVDRRGRVHVDVAPTRRSPRSCVARSTTSVGCCSPTASGDGVASSPPACPWYMTLFGRDSLWTARFALPVDVRLAAGTLRTLARRQAGDARRDDGRRAGQDPPRGAHRPADRRPRAAAASTTGRSMRRRCGSACSTTRGAGDSPTTRSLGCSPRSRRPRPG